MGFRFSSQYFCAFKLPSIKCSCVHCPYLITAHTTLFTMLTSANRLPTRCHTRGLWFWGRLDILPNSLKQCWRRLMIEKLTFSGNCSGGHSCSQHANCTLPQNLRNLWHCVVWQLPILRWPFILHRTRCNCVMIMMFNQLLDKPQRSGGWIILCKWEMLTNRCKQMCASFAFGLLTS